MKRLPILLLPLILIGCPQPGAPDAIIHYHQVGACNGFQYTDAYGDTWLADAGPNQAYVIFAIESIDNSQVSQSWTLNPTSFHVNTSMADPFDPTLSLYQYIFGPFALIGTTIPASNPYGFSPYAYGALVVQTSSANGADEANKTDYQLLYTPGSGAPGVIMEKSPPTSWSDTQDCSSIVLK